MSDSILDLSACGTTVLFRIAPDWMERPTLELPQTGREIVQYDKAAMRYRPLTAKIGWKITMVFYTKSKADEFDLLDFYNTQKAMCNKFWLPVRWNYFTLAYDIAAASKVFTPEANGFEDIVLFTERIFIMLNNGDLITRQINGLNAISPYGYLVKTAFDRNIKQTDIDIMGKLILCRFDQDEIKFKHITTDYSETTLTFQELGQEYISE